MIRKIQSSEYLKRYDNMTAAERAAYESRVGDWLSVDGQSLVRLCGTLEARLQNVLQVSAGWNDRYCQAFEDGAVLLSALTNLTDTWLPDMLYVKSAKRAIANMYTAFGAVVAQKHNDTADPSKEEPADGTGKATRAVGRKTADKGPSAGGARMQAGEAKEAGYGGGDGGAAGVSPDARPAPVRPKHVDQYVHLLPEKTQESAAQLQGLYRELDEARRKMDLLVDDGTAKDSDREAWAKRATAIDNAIRKILDELDAGWDRLVKEGRVVVDDLGNARIVSENEKANSEESAAADAPAAEEPAELTSEQKARRRELRKWLVDTRRGNGDKRAEHVGKWKESFREFLALEGDAAFDDEKVRAAAEHYGIDLEGEKERRSKGEKESAEDEAGSSDQSNQSNELDQNRPTDSEGEGTEN